jgi:DNA-binding XRE family transcriptional regulator
MRTCVRVTYPAYIRDKARKLRQERKLTIDELAERLAISRTTAYYWVRDLPGREIRYRDSPGGRRARDKGARRNSAKY